MKPRCDCRLLRVEHETGSPLRYVLIIKLAEESTSREEGFDSSGKRDRRLLVKR